MTLKAEKVAGIRFRKKFQKLFNSSLKILKLVSLPVTDVTSVTNDLSIAKVYVSFLGQKGRGGAGVKALERSKGFVIVVNLQNVYSMRKFRNYISLLMIKRGNKIEHLFYMKSIKTKNKYKKGCDK